MESNETFIRYQTCLWVLCTKSPSAWLAAPELSGKLRLYPCCAKGPCRFLPRGLRWFPDLREGPTRIRTWRRFQRLTASRSSVFLPHDVSHRRLIKLAM